MFLTVRRSAAAAVFVIGSLPLAYWAVWTVQWLAPRPQGSGGIGAVSAGLAEAVVETLVLGGAVLLNVLVVRRLTLSASDWPRLGRFVRNAHLAVSLAYMVVGLGACVGVFPAAFRGDLTPLSPSLSPYIRDVEPLWLAFVPLQVFFLAAALALWIAFKRS